jgi:hypothetical protein
MNEKNFTQTGAPKYDLHLSAYAIKPETIKQLGEFGFTRDEFANNRYCDTTAYHGSFHGWQADNDKWDEVATILSNDETFNGGLEEEIALPDFRKELSFEPSPTFIVEDYVSLVLKAIFPQKKAVPCPIGKKKACDIHINVDWQYTVDAVKKVFNELGVVSFDRPTTNSEGFNRIYTLTFEDLSEGVTCFDTITTIIDRMNTKGTADTVGILGFVGKIKLEITTRIYRQPLDGILLPLILKGKSMYAV